DAGTGDWWFSVYGDFINADIGYWPRELVSFLSTGATYMAWGGLVHNNPHEASPPMGNAHFPDGDLNKVAVIYDMHYLDENYALAEPGLFDNYLRRADRENCYTITSNGYNEKDGYNIFYGGPGGNCD
ncbi:hypothetical protein MKX03_019541, partial [Papaver bracteatum]